MSMLKLKPACTDYLWGGERLRAEYGVESDKHPLAEAWVLSCHPDGPSTIVGGPYDGRTLADYIAAEGKAVLGTCLLYTSDAAANYDNKEADHRFQEAAADNKIRRQPQVGQRVCILCSLEICN